MVQVKRITAIKAHRFYSRTTSNSALGNEVFSITAGGDATLTSTFNANRFIQTGSVGSIFYAGSFSRSGSGTVTPDIWGANGTLVLGTDSSTEAIALSGADTIFMAKDYK